VFLEVYPQVLGVSTLKRCSKCGEYKPRELFSKGGKRSKDGLNYQCKACCLEYYYANADRLRAYHREYQSTNADRVKEYNYEYYHANPERERERAREYRLANPDQVRKMNREYKRANADHLSDKKRAYRQTDAGRKTERISSIRRVARKRDLPDTLTVADWQSALDHFGGCCAACGRPRGLWHTLAADHWIPLTKGGPTTPDNIVPLCQGVNGCNNTKHNRAPAEWLIERFGKRKGRAIQRRIETYLNSCKSREEDAS
jgi:hypothetical protein